MAEDKANPTEKEVNDEVYKFSDIHIIKSGEAKRFGGIVEDLIQ